MTAVTRVTAHNAVSTQEAEDLRFILDDADMLFTLGGAARADRMLKLWRRLHLWLLSEQGDHDAKMLLDLEFPTHPRELSITLVMKDPYGREQMQRVMWELDRLGGMKRSPEVAPVPAEAAT